MKTDVLVVGAGYAGSVVARCLAVNGFKVLILEKRGHIGGNAFDENDSAGVLVHKYGPQIFHTNSERIFGFLSEFTDWRPYEHRVLASVDGQLLPMPINRDTINRLYGLSLDEDGIREFLEKAREPPPAKRNERRRRSGQRGQGSLRQILSRLYKKAVGTGPVRTQRGSSVTDTRSQQQR